VEEEVGGIEELGRGAALLEKDSEFSGEVEVVEMM
jgi:hypothetical protein